MIGNKPVDICRDQGLVELELGGIRVRRDQRQGGLKIGGIKFWLDRILDGFHS